MKKLYITINSIKPYIQEINTFLSLPINSVARVRFKKKWLKEIKNVHELKGLNGSILLRNFYDAKCIIPIRQIEIRDISEIGDILYIELLLLKIPQYPNNPKEFDELVKRMYKPISSFFDDAKFPNNNNEDLENLIFYGSELTPLKYAQEQQEYNETANWGILTTLLSQIKDQSQQQIFANYDFLKLVTFKTFDNQELSLEKTNMGGDKRCYFQLKPNSDYKISFLQRTFTGNKGDSSIDSYRKVRIKPESKEIKELKGGFIYGKYDLINVSFSTNDYRKESYSDIEVLIENHNETHNAYPVVLPVHLQTSNKEFIIFTISTVVFILGLLCYYGADTLATEKFSANSIKEVLLPLLILSGSLSVKDIKDFVMGRLTLS